MAALTGKDGAVTVANSGTINFRSWTLNDLGHISVDVTAFGNTTRINAAGIQSWSFSAVVILDGTAPEISSAASELGETTGSGKTNTGNCLFRI